MRQLRTPSTTGSPLVAWLTTICIAVLALVQVACGSAATTPVSDTQTPPPRADCPSYRNPPRAPTEILSDGTILSGQAILAAIDYIIFDGDFYDYETSVAKTDSSIRVGEQALETTCRLGYIRDPQTRRDGYASELAPGTPVFHLREDTQALVVDRGDQWAVYRRSRHTGIEYEPGIKYERTLADELACMTPVAFTATVDPEQGLEVVEVIGVAGRADLIRVGTRVLTEHLAMGPIDGPLSETILGMTEVTILGCLYSNGTTPGLRVTALVHDDETLEPTEWQQSYDEIKALLGTDGRDETLAMLVDRSHEDPSFAQPTVRPS